MMTSPYRSMLYTPGTRDDRIIKAIERRAADLVVADLEDAVAPEEKEAARQKVRAALDATRAPSDAAAQDGTTPRRAVRVNPFDTGWTHADLAATMPGQPDVVVLPKADDAVCVRVLDAALGVHERRLDIPLGRTRIIPIIETAAGVLRAASIARASPRLEALAFGAEDLAADADLVRTRSNREVLYARSHVALAAAAAAIGAIDQVFVDIDDLEGLASECREARQLGFDGKMLIHPKQVAATHQAFTPGPDEVERARALLAAVDGAGTDAGGVLRFEGKMIDVPLIRQARRVMALAELDR